MTDKTEDTHCFNIFDFASFVFVCNAMILYIYVGVCEGPWSYRPKERSEGGGDRREAPFPKNEKCPTYTVKVNNSALEPNTQYWCGRRSKGTGLL